jgi:hypothetical protein
MILLLTICVAIWFLWGAAFDSKKVPVERAIRHPGRWSKKVMRGWIADAEEVLRDPNSTEEEREKAMKDIDFFSRYVR